MLTSLESVLSLPYGKESSPLDYSFFFPKSRLQKSSSVIPEIVTYMLILHDH
jgi:hypothetical protein